MEKYQDTTVQLNSSSPDDADAEFEELLGDAGSKVEATYMNAL